MSEAVAGLVGVVIGAMITIAKDLYVGWLNRRKDGVYLAIRVVSVLDQYVEGCSEVVNDDGLCYGQRGQDGCLRPQASIPQFEIKSLDVNWKAIPARLMYDILSFPNLISSASQCISAASDFAGPPDYEEYFEERQRQYTELGLKAAKLAVTLRKVYGLPEPSYSNWNPVDYLEKQKARIEEARQRWESAQIYGEIHSRI